MEEYGLVLYNKYAVTTRLTLTGDSWEIAKFAKFGFNEVLECQAPISAISF